MTKRSCVICNNNIEESWDDDQAICTNCQKNNTERLDISKEPEKFKKELNAIFYHDIGDCNCVHPTELSFLFRRWGISNE